MNIPGPDPLVAFDWMLLLGWMTLWIGIFITGYWWTQLLSLLSPNQKVSEE